MPNHHPSRDLTAAADPDRAETARLDPRLGAEIHALRKARRLTLERLAALSGLSVGFISQIERSRNRPSVTALYKISRALGVPVNWFFFPAGDDRPSAERHVVRKAERRAIDFSHGIRDELLTPGLAGRLELLSCRFAPGAGIDSAYTHEGEEAGVVVEGELELWVGDDHYRLAAGDSFSFPSTSPHRYRNPGRREAVVIWAITPPSF